MKTLLMLCLIALITGCNSDTPQRKAEKLINRYLENNLKDPDSYECMDMGKIGIVTPMSKALVETVKRATDGEFPTDSINSKLEQIKAMFENKGINPYDTLAWEISHRYRAKNSYGGYAITNCTYHFNKDISDIKRRNKIESTKVKLRHFHKCLFLFFPHTPISYIYS